MKTIPVFFAVDNAYVPYLATALTSAIEYISKENEYKITVLHQEVTEENIKKIKSLEKDNFKIDFVPMTSGLDSITDQMSNRLRCDYFTLTIYFRLFIAEMFPHFDKALYLDSDIVIKEDLEKLYDTNLEDNFFAACRETSVGDVKELRYYMEESVGVPADLYINSGILVMNLKKMRETKFSSHFLNLLNTYHFDSVAPDQDYLNAICYGKILYLDQRWNMTPNELHPICPNPFIIHYNLFSKPWCYDKVQYESEFWHYAEKSGYIDEIKTYKDAYDDDKKQSDKKCMENLILRGIEIPKKDVTFKKVYESGVKIRL